MLISFSGSWEYDNETFQWEDLTPDWIRKTEAALRKIWIDFRNKPQEDSTVSQRGKLLTLKMKTLSLSVQHTKDTFPETKMWNVDKWASNISQFENHIRRDLPIKTISGWGSSESDQPIVSWTRSEKRPICRPNQNQKIGWNTSLSSHCMFSVYFKLILIEKDGSKIWIFCLYQNSVLVYVQFEYEQF